MSILVTGDELLEAVEKSTFIQHGDPSCAEGVKYDLRLSPRILKAKFGRPIDADQIPEGERIDLRVDPGEVVFVLTEERLALPADMVAQLSPKRKLSHAGILTLGGFCIDPGYEGRLLIGLYNLSSSPWPLIPRKKLIAATFFRLQGNEAGDFPPPTEALDDFPDELVEVMQKYQPVAMHSLVESVRGLETDLANLRREIGDQKRWYADFKELLEAHNRQIGDLNSGLRAETETRRAGEDKLTVAVQEVRDTLNFLKGAVAFIKWVLGIGLAIAIALIAAAAKKWLGY